MSSTAGDLEILERWHQCDIPKAELTELMQRSDLKGLVYTGAFFATLVGLGVLAYRAIGTPWMIPAFFAYGTVYCFLNHLMHETHHRTVFRSDWLNEAVHWIAGFAHGAEPIYDRWGHWQHHTYTYHIGNDPEVITPRPADLPTLARQFFGIGIIRPGPIINHALGIIPPADKELVPESAWKAMIWSSRLWLLGYGMILTSCVVFHTWLPLVYTVFARHYGAFIPTLLNDTQHVGLEENVMDHRLCTRNIRLDPVTSFFYWNMQYHIEHHMFPSVPFHSLARLHAKLKDQLPPTMSLWSAYREILGTTWKQQGRYDFHVTPSLPENAPSMEGAASAVTESTRATIAGETEIVDWVPVPVAAMPVNDVMGFTHDGKPYAIYHLADGYHATTGRCSHQGALLCKGLLVDGEIECPAHQGRFDARTGKATRSPACEDLAKFPVKLQEGVLLLGLPGSF